MDKPGADRDPWDNPKGGTQQEKNAAPGKPDSYWRKWVQIHPSERPSQRTGKDTGVV